jgi:anti-anti-sigma factor
MPHDDAPASGRDGQAADASPAAAARGLGRPVRVLASREASSLETEPMTQTITLAGKVDVRSVGTLRTALHCAIDTGRGTLRVDVAGLELGDDAVLGVLLGAHRRARRSGRSMVVVGVSTGRGRPGGFYRLSRVLRIEDDTPQPAGRM